MSLRCVIVDDSAAVLRAAAELLEHEGIAVLGLATTIAQALRLCVKLMPDVVLVDIDLGRESGFELARRLAETVGLGGARTILISTREEADYVELIAASPAIGFLAKSELSAVAVHRLLDRARDEGRY
jgi:DNA-binding NarL/FixJ family response regulator